MNTSSAAAKIQSKSRPKRYSTENCNTSETEEEPPGGCVKDIKSDIEPPGTFAHNGYRLLKDVPGSPWKDWKWHFRNRITGIKQLSQYIRFTPEEELQLELVTKRYPVSITPYYLSLINPDDSNDPIMKQAVPSTLEMTMSTIGLEDPLSEKEDSVVPGLVHRYPDRALMVLTDICPMLCRHCTRKREWRHGGWVRSEPEIEAILDYLQRNESVRDVIISGGDPLTLSTRRLEGIISRLRQIKHIEIIRIGSRYPVVLPQRIDNELCSMLSKYGPIWLNTHFNHPREITPEAEEACDRLLRSGIPVNNQSVLLRGVNDNVETMLKLCHGLLRIKVRPYYLFQCDEVQGTEHLRTPVEAGIEIIEGMRGHTSGLAVPTFVVDLIHGGGKVPLQPDYLLQKTKGELLLRNYQGNVYHYRNPGSRSGLREPVEEAPVSAVVENLLVDARIKLERKNAEDADRVIVRS